MGIGKDAGELLVYVYNRYIENVKWTTRENVKAETEWDTGRIDNAIEYLKDLEPEVFKVI